MPEETPTIIVQDPSEQCKTRGFHVIGENIKERPGRPMTRPQLRQLIATANAADDVSLGSQSIIVTVNNYADWEAGCYAFVLGVLIHFLGWENQRVLVETKQGMHVLDQNFLIWPEQPSDEDLNNLPPEVREQVAALYVTG